MLLQLSLMFPLLSHVAMPALALYGDATCHKQNANTLMFIILDQHVSTMIWNDKHYSANMLMFNIFLMLTSEFNMFDNIR